MANGKKTRGEQRPSAWPALEEQLAAAHVIPGSALEKLIKDNQDFEMLDPSELGDKSLPPWLKVYWLKKHPDIKYRGGVAYPHLINEIYEWMVSHQDLTGKK
jgi:hypothetical protein